MQKNIPLAQLATTLKRQAETERIGRILVGAVVILDNKILLVRRSKNDNFLPGYMEIPGGKLKRGEDILSGMHRELYEETRLRAEIVRNYVGSFDAISPDGKSARQFNFLIEPASDEIVLSIEHSQYLWWNIENIKDLNSMQMIKTIKTILQEAAEQIKKFSSSFNQAELNF